MNKRSESRLTAWVIQPIAYVVGTVLAVFDMCIPTSKFFTAPVFSVFSMGIVLAQDGLALAEKNSIRITELEKFQWQAVGALGVISLFITVIVIFAKGWMGNVNGTIVKVNGTIGDLTVATGVLTEKVANNGQHLASISKTQRKCDETLSDILRQMPPPLKQP